MSVLVLAEHDNATLSPATLNAVTAGAELGEVTVLIAGEGCHGGAEAAATAAGCRLGAAGEDPAATTAAGPELDAAAADTGLTSGGCAGSRSSPDVSPPLS